MKFIILMGSPRVGGNTAELLKPFIQELEGNGHEVEYIVLHGKDIRPCNGCYACQQVDGRYGCVQQDDAIPIMEKIIASDCVVLATPIYTWYCTAPMKALLDRHFGLNKFYRSASGSLWEGKKIAIVATQGYETSFGADIFEMGISRLCRHSKLNYMGMYAVRDEDNFASFQTESAISGAKAFARQLIGEK